MQISMMTMAQILLAPPMMAESPLQTIDEEKITFVKNESKFKSDYNKCTQLGALCQPCFLQKLHLFALVSLFNGISTIVDYLMLRPSLWKNNGGGGAT